VAAVSTELVEPHSLSLTDAVETSSLASDDHGEE
jgi:hypothetical protein